MLGDLVDYYLDSGEIMQPTGNARPGIAPRDVFRCNGDDNWVAVVCTNDSQRKALADVIGTDLASDLASWEAAATATSASISAWTSARDPRSAAAQLIAAGVPAVALPTVAERASDPHFLNRLVFLPGPPRRKGYPFVIHGFIPPFPASAPALGEHDSLIGAGVWPNTPTRWMSLPNEL
jgi:crotonobetainyl-CoA:carnitine CoA-transferase CaiB-like acyl-CoA transferase